MSFEDGRRITDPRALRALSHPVRLALLEVLRDEGPLTATQAAERVGESASNCSFHLRTLAKYGFVEEAGSGTGRQRPWRTVDRALVVPGAGLDAAGGVAVEALTSLLADRAARRYRGWVAARRHFPPRWREVELFSTVDLYLTAEELDRVGRALHAVLEPYAQRPEPERPPGAVPASITLQGFPLRPPEEAP
jgi:DNA-binding transcriptional ArsR family regulator